MVADGCVRKNVGNLSRLERAGEDEPYPTTIRLYIFAASATVEQTMEHPPKMSNFVGGLYMRS